MFNNYLQIAGQDAVELLDDNFMVLCLAYKHKREQEANEDIPAFSELKDLLKYCLSAMNGKTKYNKCIITSFIYSVLIESPQFVNRYDKFRRVSIAKVNELLQDNYVLSGQHPYIEPVLRHFKDSFQY